MRITVPNVCGECGRAYPGVGIFDDPACGHNRFSFGVRQVELGDAAFGVSQYAEAMGKDLARFKAEAIERTLAGWVKQSGLTVEQFAKLYSYKIEDGWEGTTYRFRIVAVDARSLAPLPSFSEQPAAQSTEQG